jgi:hypothetical protein
MGEGKGMKEKDKVLEKLIALLGSEYVISDPEKTGIYSYDQSFAPRRNPLYAVLPDSSSQVQEIIKLANEHRIPVVPRSSVVSLHGASIPTEGGIVVDLKRMSRILEINERNWYVIIEPGVSFLKLQSELHKKGFRAAAPLLDPPSISVVSSYMERNPVSTAADFIYGMEHIISFTIISPTGEPFTIGHPPLKNTPASAPDGPGLNFYHLFQGAQGTLGIVTWMILRVLPLPKARKVFFFPAPSMDKAIEIIHRIQKKELGLECFALNNFNLACMILAEAPEQREALQKGSYIGPQGAIPWSKEQMGQFTNIKKSLPPWTVVLCLSAGGPIPEEKIAYQELDLKEAVDDIGAEPRGTVGGIAGLNKLFRDELLNPWRMQKRYGYRGTCHPIMFCSRSERLNGLAQVLARATQKYQYPLEDVGMFLLPMERGRSFYCSYDLHCNKTEREEYSRVRDLFDKVSGDLLDQGAFFDRPYGKWASMVYDRAGTYTEYLKKIKAEIDPNHIMNPGKLCF